RTGRGRATSSPLPSWRGHRFGGGLCAVVGVVTVGERFVLGVVVVPRWALGTDLGKAVEVVVRRRRGGEPLERLGVPRVVAGRVLLPTHRHVDDEEQRREPDHGGADRTPVVEHLPLR